jgi:hypothetical protein
MDSPVVSGEMSVMAEAIDKCCRNRSWVISRQRKQVRSWRSQSAKWSRSRRHGRALLESFSPTGKDPQIVDENEVKTSELSKGANKGIGCLGNSDGLCKALESYTTTPAYLPLLPLMPVPLLRSSC